MTDTIVLDLSEAQQAAREARAAYAAIEARADAGDPDVKPGALAQSREALDLAERRVKAAQRQAEARQAAETERAREVAVAQLVDDHEASRRNIATALEDARAALTRLVDAAVAHDQVVRTDLRAVADLGGHDQVQLLGEDSEFIAVAAGRRIYLARIEGLLARLSLEVRDAAVGPGATLARSSLERGAELSPGSLAPFRQD